MMCAIRTIQQPVLPDLKRVLRGCAYTHMFDFTVAQLALCKGLKSPLLPASRGEAGMSPLRGPYPVAPKVLTPV